MTNFKTVKDICEKIWELEEELNLLELEIQGVKVWQALRMELYSEIAQRTGVIEQPHSNYNSFNQRLRHAMSFLYSATAHNPFFDRTPKDILLFEHPRKVPIEGQYIDIYTHYLIEELKEKDKTFEVYDLRYQNRHFSQAAPHRKHLDFIDICSFLYASFAPKSLGSIEREKITKVEKHLFEKFGVSLGLKRKFERYIPRFKVRYSLFRRLLRYKQCQCIFLVVSYGRAPLIKAAKDEGIQVLELQHGVFSRYHLGYSFPSTRKGALDYFPDKFLIWNEYWRSMCELPIVNKDVTVRKFDFLENKRLEHSHIRKDPKKITVVSQGTVGDQLAKTILQYETELKDYEIAYKLHPGEYDRWKSYPNLVKLASKDNVTVIDNNQKHLYTFLAESTYVIGTSSTVLFEAFDFDCQVIVLDLPGREYMDNLIKSGKVPLIRNSTELAKYLAND